MPVIPTAARRKTFRLFTFRVTADIWSIVDSTLQARAMRRPVRGHLRNAVVARAESLSRTSSTNPLTARPNDPGRASGSVGAADRELLAAGQRSMRGARGPLQHAINVETHGIGPGPLAYTSQVIPRIEIEILTEYLIL